MYNNNSTDYQGIWKHTDRKIPISEIVWHYLKVNHGKLKIHVVNPRANTKKMRKGNNSIEEKNKILKNIQLITR